MVSYKKPVLFMSASTGWAVRNFFQTGIVDKLKRDFQIVVFAPPQIKEGIINQGYGDDLIFIVLNNLREPLSWRLFRQLKKKIYFESRESTTEAIWEKHTKRSFYKKVGGKIVGALLKAFKATTLLNLIETIDLKINKSSKLSKEFILYKPAIFFATHASSFFEELLLRSAVMHNIPIVFMVLSWDHLSSKIVLSKKYHSIFVWNKLTKSEILQTYPFYKDEQIKVVGVPQYDIYKEKSKISYSEWCQKYGLDPNRKTILFSTMPQVRHSEQHIILENLLKTIVEGKFLPNNLQVLIKCHPFDDSNKYDFLLGKYPISIYKSTLPPGLPFEYWIPRKEEMYIARDSLYFCDININIFSTVTLEAAFFDKPIIHIAFDPHLVKNRIPCKEYYNFEHFKNITKMKAAKMVYSFEDLYKAINDYLKNPNLNNKERKDLVRTYFNIQPGLASDNVVKELVNLKNTLVNN